MLRSTLNIAVTVLSGAVGAFAVLLLAVLVGYWTLDLSFLPTASCGKGDDLVYCFFDDRWDSETYLAIITNFYSTIITVLLALIALVAGVAYMAIRSSAFQRAEETIEREVVRFFKTDEGNIKIRKGLEAIGVTEYEKTRLRLDVIEVALEEADIPFEKLRLDDEEKTEKAH